MSSKFAFQTTDDGSPTLEIMRSDGKVEKMHHFMGAFSETVHVYGRALEIALNKGLPPHIFSLGLGLGYNEIMSVAVSLKYQLSPQIWSFETEESLKAQFRNWVMGEKAQDDFTLAYEKVLEKMNGHFGVLKTKESLKRLMISEDLKLLEGFSSHYDLGEKKFSVILYDAFSDKINPELWDLEALDKVLSSATEEKCVFATYASKGRLKRALKHHGFELLDIAGYASKRECTIAVR